MKLAVIAISAVGPSSEDWFPDATTQKLQAKQREKEERNLFMSPVSQCSSQLTPDILKFHRGRTYGLFSSHTEHSQTLLL